MMLSIDMQNRGKDQQESLVVTIVHMDALLGILQHLPLWIGGLIHLIWVIFLIPLHHLRGDVALGSPQRWIAGIGYIS